MLYINAFSSSSDCPRPLATSLINCSAFTSSKSLLNSFPLQYSPVNSVNRFILVKVNSSHQAFHYPRCRSPLALGRTEHQPHRNSNNTVQRWLKIRPFLKLSSVAFKKNNTPQGCVALAAVELRPVDFPYQTDWLQTLRTKTLRPSLPGASQQFPADALTPFPSCHRQVDNKHSRRIPQQMCGCQTGS